MDTDLMSRQTISSLLMELVQIPSVNPTLAPEEGHNEQRLADFCGEWLTDHRVATRLEEIEPGRPNVIGEAGLVEGPVLVLCAHLDTVGTTGMTIPPFEPTVVGDRLYGRGSYDMKGGIAAAMVAAAELAATDMPGRLMLALVSDEEYSSIGAEAFADRYIADGCIITEPTGGQLILAHKGFLWAEIRTEGKAAHGSRWDLGISAVGKMGPVIVSLESHDRLVLRERIHDLVGPASLHPAIVSGGVGLSTYAPDCTLKVERRTLPGEKRENVEKELLDVVADSGQQAETDCFFYRSPMACDPDEAIARSTRQAVLEITGMTPTETGVGYWTDGGIFSDAGIPTVLYGPSGEGAHAAEEWVDIESVLTCARVLVNAARHFCAG
jgi:acetylornithine deacetylase